MRLIVLFVAKKSRLLTKNGLRGEEQVKGRRWKAEVMEGQVEGRRLKAEVIEEQGEKTIIHHRGCMGEIGNFMNWCVKLSKIIISPRREIFFVSVHGFTGSEVQRLGFRVHRKSER